MVLRLYSDVMGILYRTHRRSVKLLSPCDIKDFFQQSQPFFITNIDKFYHFSHGAPKETHHPDEDALAI